MEDDRWLRVGNPERLRHHLEQRAMIALPSVVTQSNQ